MAEHDSLNSLFTDIADAIREKTGGTESIVANNFPEEILKIASGTGKQEMVTLWVNPSPTKAFAAQTVALDLSKYAGIIIYSKTSTSTSGDGVGQFCEVTESHSVTLHCAWAVSYTRAATISYTGITFKEGKNNAVSPPSTANSSCIPTKIVGIDAIPRNIKYKYHEAFLTTSSKMTINCGFKPTRIMINIGVLDTGISNSNYKANIVIDADGYWTDVHTNASGGSSYSNQVAMGSTAMGCTWNITDTGFEITCTNSNYTANKWCFNIVGE